MIHVGCNSCLGADSFQHMECKTDAECLTDAECQLSKCDHGECKITSQKSGDPCGPTEMHKVCDTSLKCVKCRIDGSKNDPEGGIDCGQYCDERCADKARCTVDADCKSSICHATLQVCLSPSCKDKTRNSDESDLDCGGECGATCAAGQSCSKDGDCAANHCVSSTCCAVACEGRCRTCAGGACSFVPDGGTPTSPCNGTADMCDGRGHCTTCTNGHKDDGETGIDCGGPLCAPCGVGESCLNAGDCATCTCVSGTCGPPTCADSIKNGCETDVDCGGPCGPTCTFGQLCKGKADCLSAGCTDEKCDFEEQGGPDAGCDAKCDVMPQDDPTSDTCPGPSTTLTGGKPFQLNGFTSGYTDDYQPCNAQVGGADRAFAFLASEDGIMTVNVSADFDVVLAVAKTCINKIPDGFIGCSDEHPSSSQLEQLKIPVTSGSIYFVVVDGYNKMSFGAFMLTATLDK